jgi:hypothetical protein
VWQIAAGSKSFGQACQLSEDGRTALVLDASRGAMMYSREAHTPRGAAAAYRAAGWLAGAPGRQQYRVAAAGLGADGRQAALLVQGGSTSDATAVSNATLKVFAANSFGQWSDVCSIPLAVAPSRAGKTIGFAPTIFHTCILPVGPNKGGGVFCSREPTV